MKNGRNKKQSDESVDTNQKDQRYELPKMKKRYKAHQKEHDTIDQMLKEEGLNQEYFDREDVPIPFDSNKKLLYPDQEEDSDPEQH